MPSLDVTVTLRGPFFTKDATRVVAQSIAVEVFDKATAIVEHPSQKVQRQLGFRRNRLTNSRGVLMLSETTTTAGANAWRRAPLRRASTRRPGTGTPRPGWQEKIASFNPRISGRAWVSKNLNRLKYALPNQARATAKRIINELGGA